MLPVRSARLMRVQVLVGNTTNIMFNLFDGEAFGYIGSSAMGSKMRNGSYPNNNESSAEVS